jgi:hypothetical protein
MVARAALVLSLLGSFACGQVATVRTAEGRPDAYEIECVKAAGCVAKAREVCGERFDVVSEWEQPLAMPDGRPALPDYPRVVPQQVAEWQGYSTNTGPSDGARAMPVYGINVVCVN